MFIYAFLILLPALTLADDPMQKLEDKLFNAIDDDKNGKISENETETFFMDFDDDKDDEVSKDEFKKSMDKLDSDFIGKEDALFKLFDRKMDGVVKKEDIDELFKLADTNEDMNMDKKEFHMIFHLAVTMVG